MNSDLYAPAAGRILIVRGGELVLTASPIPVTGPAVSEPIVSAQCLLGSVPGFTSLAAELRRCRSVCSWGRSAVGASTT